MSKLDMRMRSVIQHYNEKRYWRYRNIVTDSQNKMPKFIKILLLVYIKRCDAFNNASLGTHINYGAFFKSIPNFPHGLYGIIVSHNAMIGKNCTIFHQVTIGERRGGGLQL